MEKKMSLLYTNDLFYGRIGDKIASLDTACSTLTDLAILSGAEFTKTEGSIKCRDDEKLKNNNGLFYLCDAVPYERVSMITGDGHIDSIGRKIKYRNGAIRPIIHGVDFFTNIEDSCNMLISGTNEIKYGEYPQNVPDKETIDNLEEEYQQNRLTATGKKYTFNKIDSFDGNALFDPYVCKEYAYKDKKYIRFSANFYSGTPVELSNGVLYCKGDIVWVEVEPVKWIYDKKKIVLVSIRGLLSNIVFDTNKDYRPANFEDTYVFSFMNKYMRDEIFQKTPEPINQQINSPRNFNEECTREFEPGQHCVLAPFSHCMFQANEVTNNKNLYISCPSEYEIFFIEGGFVYFRNIVKVEAVPTGYAPGNGLVFSSFGKAVEKEMKLKMPAKIRF